MLARLRRAWRAFWADEGPPAFVFYFPPDVAITEFNAQWIETPLGGEPDAKEYLFHA